MFKKAHYLLLAAAVVSAVVMPACSAKATDAETEGVQYIYEVEKLARDVYQNFFDKWQTPVLSVISGSEQSHMDIMKEVVDKYSMADPVAGKGAGEFTNTDLQQLYSDLLAGGSSEVGALSTAAAIEEFDIVDIAKKVQDTSRDDILAAYAKLTEGSQNHLRIFVSKLAEQSVQYQPQYLSQQEYDQIISAVPPADTTVIPAGDTFDDLAATGKAAYAGNCFNCHANSLSTGPASSATLAKYGNAQALLTKISAMPASGQQERWEVLSYLLLEHGWVSGSTVFNADTLSQIPLSQ